MATRARWFQFNARARQSLAIAVLCLTASSGLRAQDSDAAIGRLASVTIFAFGGVGIAGVQSAGEKDFEAIRMRPSAIADFEQVFAAGNLQAKCYALAALRSLRPALFDALSAPLRNSERNVMTMQGCILLQRKTGDLIREIESGRYAPWSESGIKLPVRLNSR